MPLVLTEGQCRLLILLSNEGVRFLVIGGYAVKAHGVDRPTQDIDLWLSPSKQNAKKVARGFEQLGHAPPAGTIWVEVLSKPNVRFAYPADGPGHEGDILTSIGDLDFDARFNRSVEIALCGKIFQMPNRDDLIEIKKVSSAAGNNAAKKAQDLEDINALMGVQDCKPVK